MVKLNRRRTSQCGLLAALILLAGCGEGGETPRTVDGAATQVAESADNPAPDGPQPAPAPDFSPVVLGGATPAATDETPDGEAADPAERRQEVLAAMMPLQIMLGGWRGTTFRQVGNFKGVDEPHWVWDFQTDRNQPALVMTSADGTYFRELRLTYLTDLDRFRMTSTGPDDETRTFDGEFTETPAEVRGDDNRPQVTYKLTLTELDSDDTDERWQVVFNQQENNRYLLELYRQRGESFSRLDTISTQREGTSIAASDEDYGDRKCVISGGLGTIQVSYKGRTFWVCCTGCKAAFEEDPESWIAEYDAARE